MRLIPILFLLTLITLPGPVQATVAPQQSPIDPKAKVTLNYPRIVLYSVSWCPHCRAAKEYFTHNNIPFINKDVELDPQALEELTKKYKSQGVPVIVIGDDEQVLKGFSEENLIKALHEVQKKIK